MNFKDSLPLVCLYSILLTPNVSGFFTVTNSPALRLQQGILQVHWILTKLCQRSFRGRLSGPQVTHTSVQRGYKGKGFSQIPHFQVWWFSRMSHSSQERAFHILTSDYKWHNSRTSQWKGCVEQGMGWGMVGCGASLLFLDMPLSQCLNVFTNLEALWTLPFIDFYGGFIQNHDWHWWITSHPPRSENRKESCESTVMPWSFWQPAHILEPSRVSGQPVISLA